jgi:DNA-binding NarL/FixJ family response regulator
LTVIVQQSTIKDNQVINYYKVFMTAIKGNRTKARERRVLLIEDRDSFQDSIGGALPRIGLSAVTERASSEPDFTRALQEFEPDVVLSDPALISFPSETALRSLQASRSTAPLIVVADVLHDTTAVACLRAGAEDFVLKENLGRLNEAIETALAIREPLKKLSPRQLEVLRLVTQGYTTKEIAERLSLSVKTVESHRGELTRRLGIREVAGLVRYAVRVGMIPVTAPAA